MFDNILFKQPFIAKPVKLQSQLSFFKSKQKTREIWILSFVFSGNINFHIYVQLYWPQKILETFPKASQRVPEIAHIMWYRLAFSMKI